MNLDSLAFFILVTNNIKTSAGLLNVTEVFRLINKDLEPLRVGAPDLHVVCLTRVLDVPGLIVVSCPDCQGLLMEVPFLSWSTVISLDNHVTVVDQV